MESLNLSDSPLLVEELDQLRAKLNRVKQRVTDKLYDVIPNKTDPKIQNLLLNCRRDIFNQRDIPTDKLDLALIHLPNSLNKELRDYLKLKESFHRLWQKGENRYRQELIQARQHLHTLAGDETLQKGLLLSSQSLLKRIPDYTAGDPGKVNKKNRQTERGLIKYISRMYCKTSPFSTFTNLAIGHPESIPGNSPFLGNGDGRTNPAVVSHIRLNNLLYKYLKALLYKNPDIYRLIPLRPNPTLQTNDDHYLFLTNNDNVEAFQRIPANPALEVFRELAAAKVGGVPVTEMIQSIVKNELIDAQADQLEDYIRQLIDYGFLEFNLGVSGIDPDWDIKLKRVLESRIASSRPHPLLKELSRVLESLRELADQYGQAPVSRRRTILAEAFGEFRAMCFKLHRAAGLPEAERLTPEENRSSKQKENKSTEDREPEEVFKHHSNTFFYFKPEHMFYEDATIGNSLLLEETVLTEFVGDLHELLQQMRHFEGHLEERDKMLHFFNQSYVPGAEVRLMTFYEEFYREFKKPEAQSKQEGKIPEHLAVPRFQQRVQRQNAWIKGYRAQLKEKNPPNNDVLFLSRSGLEKSLRSFPTDTPPQPEEGCSFGCFIQFYHGNTEHGEKPLMGVVNATFTGFGKLFSRFLHIFPETITEDLLLWNREAGGNVLLVEDTDASYFNANLHPPLLPYEIRIPGGHNTLPPSQQIPITELLVKKDQSGDRLQLIHGPTGRRVHVLDLGFQSQSGRSQLFQLLEKFTLAEQLSFWPLVNAAIPDDTKDQEVRILPRVVYRDRLILRRKSWDIPVERLPFGEPGESGWAYFERLNRWRLELGLPNEVFVYVADRYKNAKRVDGDPGQNRPKPSPDDYKPQYICFHNPFLVDLFQHLLKRTHHRLRVVEMLPGSRQLLPVGRERCITEFTVQWYTGKKDQISKKRGYHE